MQNGTPQMSNKRKDKSDSVYTPKQKRSEKTHAAIIAAARELIIEAGAKSLTITDVAARAGLTTGALYARFRNKDAMIEALYRDTVETDRKMIEEYLAAMEKRQATPAERVREGVRMSLRSIREHGALFRLLSVDFMQTRQLRQHVVEMLEANIKILQDDMLKHREDFPHPDPELASIMLVALLQGTMDWVLLFNESPSNLVNITDEVLIEEVSRAVLGYLGLGSTEEDPTQPKGSSGKS